VHLNKFKILCVCVCVSVTVCVRAFYNGSEIKARLFPVPSGALVTGGSGVPRTLKRTHMFT